MPTHTKQERARSAASKAAARRGQGRKIGKTTFQKSIILKEKPQLSRTSTDTLKSRGKFSASKSTTEVSARSRQMVRTGAAQLRSKVGGTSTDRLRGRLAKISKAAKKSRSPVAISFALGLDHLLRAKKAKVINAGPI